MAKRIKRQKNRVAMIWNVDGSTRPLIRAGVFKAEHLATAIGVGVRHLQAVRADDQVVFFGTRGDLPNAEVSQMIDRPVVGPAVFAKVGDLAFRLNDAPGAK